MTSADPFRILEEDLAYEDLRDIEDWARDRGKEGANGFTEYELLQYSIEMEMYSREDIGAKFSNPSENPELGIELMEGPKEELRWAQVVASISAAAYTGDPVSGFAAGLATYGFFEFGTRTSGYLWAKGRDRDNIQDDSHSPYGEEKERALQEFQM